LLEQLFVPSRPAAPRICLAGERVTGRAGVPLERYVGWREPLAGR